MLLNNTCSNARQRSPDQGLKILKFVKLDPNLILRREGLDVDPGVTAHVEVGGYVRHLKES